MRSVVRVHPGPPNRGAIAQPGEHRLCKPGVGGSNPPGSTILPLGYLNDFLRQRLFWNGVFGMTDDGADGAGELIYLGVTAKYVL